MLKYPRIRVVEVFLGDGEYGTPLMDKAAREAAANIPFPVLVNVTEHAGWHMSYFFGDGENGTIVGTANDGAVFSNAQEVLRGHIAKAKMDYVPEIRRPALLEAVS